MAQYDTITSLLGRIGLRHLVENFKTQRIDSIDTCKRLADTDLLSLGLSTIGDRARFRAEITACHENASTGDSRAFLASRSRFSRKKPARRKTWTGTFVCLADHNQTKVPCQEEKVCLQRAGLGVKKITFDSEASESEVDSVITGESGFKKLEGCGGYELLHCRSNCRNLSKIDVSWDVKSLKTVVGGQSKIYIRPIQTSLELQFENEEANTSNIKFPCMICGVEFNVRDLREHANTCLKTDNPTDNEVVNKDTTFETPFEINMPLDLNNLEFFSADLSDTVQIESSAEKSTQQVDSPTETASTFSGIENHQQNEQSEIQKITESCIEGISSQEITDPIHGLRFLQTKIVTGRKLDLEEEDLESGLTCADCSTNYIIVDRNHILSTGMDEIKELNDLRLTLEVQFYGENAEDYGGPRKEFFSLILPELKAKYFEPVRDWISLSEYETAGKIIALCLLQNGKLPRILDVNTLAELFEDSPRGVLSAFAKGLDSLGIFQIMKAHTFLRHLITPVVDPPVTLKKITNLLSPNFAPDGSNRRSTESVVYQKFIKYMRELAAGKRDGMDLGMILQFVTGVNAEPPLGFGIRPSISFIIDDTFVPRANTCTNKLTLPIPAEGNLPDDETLFKLYDYAFCNSYFGLA